MSYPEIDGFEILSLVGRGGMGAVYCARQTSTGRAVALKILNNPLSSDPEFVLRFKREAAALAALAHPSVAEFIDHGRSGDSFYLAMEFVEGEPLSERIADGPFPLARACLTAAEVADALAAAHACGLVHRDVKPSNIILSPSGAKLTDFGLARKAEGATITTTGRVMGSLPYMSPERIRGAKATTLSDIYSLGAVLFEMLTGQLPYEAEDDGALVSRILTQPPPIASRLRPDIPVGLDLLLIRLLAKEEDLRPGNAAELVGNLREIAEGGTRGRAQSPGAPRRDHFAAKALAALCRFVIRALPPGKAGSRMAHAAGARALSLVDSGGAPALRIEAGLALRRARDMRREIATVRRKRDKRLERAQSAHRHASTAGVEERQDQERFAREMLMEAEIFEKRMDELVGKPEAEEKRARALTERAAAGP